MKQFKSFEKEAQQYTEKQQTEKKKAKTTRK